MQHFQGNTTLSEPNQLHVWGGCHPHRVSNHAWPLLATSVVWAMDHCEEIQLFHIVIVFEWCVITTKMI